MAGATGKAGWASSQCWLAGRHESYIVLLYAVCMYVCTRYSVLHGHSHDSSRNDEMPLRTDLTVSVLRRQQGRAGVEWSCSQVEIGM